ncbi:MAG: 1-acyl-sn-glycerol-3-phosphate acyltransferase [Lewinella sp.]|nr:1-acyl-sn-glycerol-3-phosphate acyltransferase [Lewinella sp.]
MNPFLYGLYQLLKLLTWVVFRVFYPRTRTEGMQHLHFRGPGLLVSNHPNTLLDPLNAAVRARQQVFFLANAGLFNHPVANWLLNRLYCIPIKRQHEKGGQHINNADSFKRSHDHLAQGGVMYIAPEGGSELERRLRPIKTGTARIALGAEARHDFQLGVHIYPVGLNYEHPQHCGSRQFVRAGEPIRVADWQDAYRADPINAVRDLTHHLAASLQDLLIHTEDLEQDKLLYRLETILQHDEPVSPEDYHFRGRHLLTHLKQLRREAPNAYTRLQEEAADYRRQLRELHLTDRGLAPATPARLGWWGWIGAPFWLYGRLNNLLPYELPRLLQRRLGLYPGYDATVKILGGILLVPLFYWLQTKLVALACPGWGWVYLLSLPLSAWLAWTYAGYVQPRREKWRWQRFQQQQPEQARTLAQARAHLQYQANQLLA